jgi:hypothetical protein
MRRSGVRFISPAPKIESPSLLRRGAFSQKEADVMRALFGIASLLIVLAIVGILAKKQLGGTASVAPATAPGASPQQQPIQQQIQQTVEGAMQQARPMPEDAPK